MLAAPRARARRPRKVTPRLIRLMVRRKSHNLTLLIGLLPVRYRPDMTADERLRTTDYAIVTRYPGDYEPITLTEAHHAVALAPRLRRQVRRSLPKPALQAH